YKNIRQGYDLLMNAADQGYPDALCELGYMYMNGIVQNNSEKAIHYLRMAAERGNPRATYILGFNYLEGGFFVKDENKGLELLNKAADLNFPNAFLSLGIYFIKRREFTEGLKLINKAVELGSREAKDALINLQSYKKS